MGLDSARYNGLCQVPGAEVKALCALMPPKYQARKKKWGSSKVPENGVEWDGSVQRDALNVRITKINVEAVHPTKAGPQKC